MVTLARISVYYDYFLEGMCPIWMLIYFGSEKIPWDSGQIYIPINAPFKRKTTEDYLEHTVSMSIALEHLLVNPYHPGQFGINLKLIHLRLKQQFIDPALVEQFTVQICDIEEIMQIRNKRYFDHSGG